MILRIKILLLLVGLYCFPAFGQMQDYQFKRKLTGIDGIWNQIILPEALFENLQSGLNDIRIYGITSEKDTVEVPYLLQPLKGKRFERDVEFKIINTARNKEGYFFTLEVPSQDVINQIKLNFEQQNFDWRITLEGSQNQQEWFTITEDYRILSIVNEDTNYQFTKVNIPSAKFKFLRLLVNSEQKPLLAHAKLVFHDTLNSHYKTFQIKNFEVSEDEELHNTMVNIDLKHAVPVSFLKLSVINDFDYYRPVTIDYISDSIRTEKGMRYKFKTLFQGTISSLEKNEFKFKSSILKQLRITVFNLNNEPLNFGSAIVKGYEHQLVARFNGAASYYLVYGNLEALSPDYDIKNFRSKIPKELNLIDTGEEEIIIKNDIQKNTGLFKNKIWLWVIMVVIMVLLAWFSLKMLKTK
ncbi:DUF3999 family protein [Gaetbulibacter saemankumensis]|uniref:DUF3999 family protein n=1 Tax=Gaetbulibacter saemankumensis TaxID=311208 RepID=UPI0004825E0F|nr:DUF3999 family protein [Gaetbulibacter saemankumensis]